MSLAYASTFCLKESGLINDACPWWFIIHDKMYVSEITGMYTSDFCLIIWLLCIFWISIKEIKSRLHLMRTSRTCFPMDGNGRSRNSHDLSVNRYPLLCLSKSIGAPKSFFNVWISRKIVFVEQQRFWLSSKSALHKFYFNKMAGQLFLLLLIFR